MPYMRHRHRPWLLHGLPKQLPSSACRGGCTRGCRLLTVFGCGVCVVWMWVQGHDVDEVPVLRYGVCRCGAGDYDDHTCSLLEPITPAERLEAVTHPSRAHLLEMLTAAYRVIGVRAPSMWLWDVSSRSNCVWYGCGCVWAQVVATGPQATDFIEYIETIQRQLPYVPAAQPVLERLLNNSFVLADLGAQTMSLARVRAMRRAW